MCGHDVGQGFLQDVVGAGFRQQTVNVEAAHGFHAAHAGALGGGYAGGVDGPHDLCGGKTAGKEGVDGADEVPAGDTVQIVGHVCGDAPHLGVEAFGDLTADEAAHGHAAGHADGGACGAGDDPLPCLRVDVCGGAVLGVDEGACIFLGCDLEAQRLVEVDGGQFGG